MVAEYHNQSKLRFWCQMVLPLVYDDSLSYMELLNKVVNYLNNCIQDVGNCETNIELLLDAFESLQDYVNEMVEDISPEIESVIDQMIENGDFTEILTDALNTVVAPEYDEETTYLQYEYVLYEGNLYRANTTTSGEFDPTKWTEKTIAQDLTVLERYVYGLTANDVPYDGTQTYDAGSTGKAIKDLAAEVDSLDAGDIAYNSSTTYNNATVGKELGDLKDAIKFILTSTGDTTDRKNDIMNCLNNYGACMLGNGIFYINSSINMPDGSSLIGIGSGTILQLSDNSTDNIAINVGSYCTVENMTIKGNSTELPYSSYTQGNRKGIALLGDYTDFNTGTYSHNFAKLSNLTIQDFNHSGIWAYKNDGAASFLAVNIDILRCHTGVNIELFSEFHSFTNIRCRYCNIACVMQGGNNLFANCHFDANLMGIKIDGTNNSLVNADHSSFVNCSVCHPDNNTGYAIWLHRSLVGLLFSNCQFWYGKISIDTCSCVKFNNNIIGGFNSNVTINSSNKITFTDNLFKETSPSVTITSCLRIIWENNQNGNGDLVYRPENRGSVSDLNSNIIQSGNYPNISFQNFGYCGTAGQYYTVIPLPFMINSSNATFTLNRVVILGKGVLPDADLSNIIVTFEPTYVRAEGIAWASAQVGDIAIIDIRGNLSF